MGDEQRVDKEIIVRPARPEDYPGYRQMEEKVFSGTNIPLLEEAMFLEWIRVYSEGFVLGVVDGRVCGHMYAQICDYDPLDNTDNRNLYELTDNMWTTKSHDPKGNCVYAFSICSMFPGIAKKINEYFILLTQRLNKKYYAGGVYMPGLNHYINKMNRKRVTQKFVCNYVHSVISTIKGDVINKDDRVFDPVITPLLKLNMISFARVIKDFYPYHKGADRWGCLMFYNNTN